MTASCFSIVGLFQLCATHFVLKLSVLQVEVCVVYLWYSFANLTGPCCHEPLQHQVSRPHTSHKNVRCRPPMNCIMDYLGVAPLEVVLVVPIGTVVVSSDQREEHWCSERTCKQEECTHRRVQRAVPISSLHTPSFAGCCTMSIRVGRGRATLEERDSWLRKSFANALSPLS